MCENKNNNYDVELAVMKLARLTKRHGEHRGPHHGPHHGPCHGHGPNPEFGPHQGMRALCVIADNENPSSRELAELLDIRPSSLTEVLNRLEEHGLIIRTPDENDKRVSRVSLTEKGKEVAAEMKIHREEREAQMSACFTQEEKEQFCALCDKLAAHWENLAKERAEKHREDFRKHCKDDCEPKPFEGALNMMKRSSILYAINSTEE